MSSGLLYVRGYRHRQIKTAEGTMHALVCKGKGSMPPVVVLPGLGTRVSDYGLMLWRLKPRCKKVVAIDLPGHGKSRLKVPVDSRSFARAIMDTKKVLAPEPSFMLGHSLGALGSVKSYLLAPQQVLGMTLVTPPGGPVSPAVIRDYTRKFDIRSWGDAAAIAEMTYPRPWLPHLFSPAALSQRLSTPQIRSLLRSDVLTAHLQPSHLSSLPRHTMFVWAGREKLLPRDFRSYFLRHLPTTTRVWEPVDMAHGDIAWGHRKYLNPILKFFENAHRDLVRTGDSRLTIGAQNTQRRLRKPPRLSLGGDDTWSRIAQSHLRAAGA